MTFTSSRPHGAHGKSSNDVSAVREASCVDTHYAGMAYVVDRFCNACFDWPCGQLLQDDSDDVACTSAGKKIILQVLGVGAQVASLGP
jgi:hypothetical protein